MALPSNRPVSVCLIVGEESGDALGADLMNALDERLGSTRVSYCGVGGSRMEALGLKSAFDISDIAVMGISAVLARLPLIVRRVYQAVDAVIAADPDIMIIIDSPDFTHNVAKRVRKRAPHIPIVGYVSPSVWAWRPGRARKMSIYVDELLALLPFEPDVHEKLGGPRTHYVGHPLVESVSALRPGDGERTPVSADRKVLVVLPGSRRSEVTSLLADFGKTVALLKSHFPGLEVLLPAVPHLLDPIREGVAHWQVKPEILEGQEAKLAAFRRAHAALAASGTVSLELALSGVPMVIAYQLDWFIRRALSLNRFIRVYSLSSIVLPNIILGHNVIPEFIDSDVEPDALAGALRPLMSDSKTRQEQLAAFESLDMVMRLPGGKSQRIAAADVVIDVLGRSSRA